MPEHNLLLSGYFARYGELLGESETPYEAWLKTEREFSRRYSSGCEILRRFTTYDAFQDAHRRFRSGHRVLFIKIQILTLEEVNL